MIEIEKDIAPPESGVSRKYPLAQMEVGASFLVPAASEAERKRAYLSVLAAVRRMKKGTERDIDFRIRKVSQEQIEIHPQLDPAKKGAGVRCWRIK